MAFQLTSIDFFCPPIVASGEQNILRAFVYGTGGSLAAVDIYVIPPNGGATEITDQFIDVSASFPATFLSQFQTEYTFQQPGMYVFIVHDTATGDVWIDKIYCAEWASKIDVPVSQLGRQRADIQRIYGRVNK